MKYSYKYTCYIAAIFLSLALPAHEPALKRTSPVPAAPITGPSIFQFQNLPPELKTEVVSQMDPRQLSNFRMASKSAHQQATNITLRRLSSNLGILYTSREAVDTYLKEYFDVTIDPQENSYRLYISPFQALDIFDDKYVKSRKKLAEDGLHTLFKGQYDNQDEEIFIMLQDKWLHTLKAIPPFSKEQVQGFKEFLKAQLVELAPDANPRRPFDALWAHSLSVNINIDLYEPALLPRVPLTLLPRTIWLLVSRDLNVQSTHLLTLPSLPGRDNYMEIPNVVRAKHNNIRKIPAYRFKAHWMDANLFLDDNPAQFKNFTEEADFLPQDQLFPQQDFPEEDEE